MKDLKDTTKRCLSSIIPGRLLRYVYSFRTLQAIKINQLGLIYIPIEKVASNSIKTCLADKIELNYDDIQSAHWEMVSVNELDLYRDDHYTFSFVRDPFDRLVSCYVQKFVPGYTSRLFWKYGNLISENMNFQEFAEFVIETPDSLSDNHFKSQHQFLSHNDKLNLDFIGKYENLDADWGILARKFDLATLPHLNSTKREPLDSYFSYDLAKKTSERYALDIKLFNYQSDVESLLSRLKAK